MTERFDFDAPCRSPLLLATIGLLEVVVTCVVVVGFFAAAAQPFGWSSAVQFLLCGVLGGLLWYADRNLDVDDLPAAAPERPCGHRAPVYR